METKKWYESKMVIFNILTAIAFIVTFATGKAMDNGELEIIASAIIAIVNIVLRFKTNTGIS